MPPKFSAAELKRRRGVRAAYFAGKPKPTLVPVPIKRLKPAEPSLVSIPAPTSSVIEQLPPSVSIETIEEWASADAKAHVYQASQNATRPLGSKTTNPLPDKLPAQRKYFDQLGFVIRSERFQLSLAQNAEYVRFYREYLKYLKEIQASQPVQKAVEFTNPTGVGSKHIYWYTREDGTEVGPWESPNTRDVEMAKESSICTPHNGFSGTRSTKSLYWFDYIGTDDKSKRSDMYISSDFRDAAMERLKRDKDGNLVKNHDKFYPSDNAPQQAKDKDGEVVTKLAPIVYGHKPIDKWHNAAHEDLSSLKASAENVPFLESLDANKLHPVMFCEKPADAIKIVAAMTNYAAETLRMNALKERVDHRQNVSGGDNTEFNKATGTLRRVD